DAFDRAAVIHQHDNVLRHVDQAAGQVARLRRAQRRVGQALAGAVAGDEVLHYSESVAEVAAYGDFHDAPRGIGHQAAHTRELADLLELGFGRAGVGDGVDGTIRVEHRLHMLLDRVRGVVPDLHDLAVAFLIGDQALTIVLLQLGHAL